MSTWLEASVRRGILTTRYPASAATADEVPATGRGPRARPGASGGAALADACPVGAIGPETLDQGRCIRCARCLPRGFDFSGPVEASTTDRAALLEPRAAPPLRTADSEAPLRPFSRSLHVFLVDVGSCNACNLEVLALANPYYDSQRLGIFFTNSPRHADVLLVVGVPTPEMAEPLRRAFEALPGPKAVVAVGACPISGGVFRGNPDLTPSLADLVPVDVFVPGCPPTPLGVLDGILRAAGRARREAVP
ncbi:MAG TPA: NADH:ubiquinone oxidoreductase [Thermoplasmata archaeon]|nr:NADH:ubiquinone oxidoreductase [Thermoplasmata archaeon]